MLPDLPGIYELVNRVNGKVYVGQARSIRSRLYEHKYQCKNKKYGNYKTAIHAAIRKYGIDNFSVNVLELCSRDELDLKEIEWITRKKSMAPAGYNLQPGGQRYKKKYAKQNYCADCGARIDIKAVRCPKCAALNGRKVKSIDFEAVILEIGTGSSISKAAEKLGLSDTALAKRMKLAGLPHNVSKIREFYRKKNGMPEPVKREKIDVRKRVIVTNVKTGETRTFQSRVDAGKYFHVSGRKMLRWMRRKRGKPGFIFSE